MIEKVGNVFKALNNASALVVTTNGTIKKNGEAVMGRGLAYQISNKIPAIPKLLGSRLKKYRNRVYCFRFPKDILACRNLITFPVKPGTMQISDKWEQKSLDDILLKRFRGKFKPGDTIPGFMFKANLKIIEDSTYMLKELANTFAWNKIIMTRPGCNNGELDWKQVRVLLKSYLDDRFYIYTLDKDK